MFTLVHSLNYSYLVPPLLQLCLPHHFQVPQYSLPLSPLLRALKQPPFFLHLRHTSPIYFLGLSGTRVCAHTGIPPGTCGHRFCHGCLQEAVNLRHACPVCNAPLEPDQIRRDHQFDSLAGEGKYIRMIRMHVFVPAAAEGCACRFVWVRRVVCGEGKSMSQYSRIT